MSSGKIVILCSGVALGVYIPGMLVNYQLRQRGFKTEVVVLENLIAEEKRNKIKDNKKAFHKSFSVALTGQRMARDIRPNIDDRLLGELFRRWAEEGITDFIVFSGFWATLLLEYRDFIHPCEISAECCHMDADISASWKNAKNADPCFANAWLFDNRNKKIVHKLKVNEKKPVPYDGRKDRMVIHGGGWGMGTYLSKIDELGEKGFCLDIVVYDAAEIGDGKRGERYFMIDPSWSPWHSNDNGEHIFPPFGEVTASGDRQFRDKAENHELFDRIGESKAIVSKPGGATLVDSLASATPIIMLEPFGDYERKNAELWEYLGYGIPYEKWSSSGYAPEVLKQLHLNILKSQDNYKDYVQGYLERSGR